MTPGFDGRIEADQLAREAIKAAKGRLIAEDCSASDVVAALKVIETLSKNPLFVPQAASFDEAKKDLEKLAGEKLDPSAEDLKLRAV